MTYCIRLLVEFFVQVEGQRCVVFFLVSPDFIQMFL